MIYVFIATKTTADAAIPTQAANQADFNRRVSGAFKAQMGSRLTVGDLKLRPNGNAIPNHLLCDGAAISRSKFSELFRLLGEVEGPGDGSTTFNLPDYSGALVAQGDGVQTITERGTVEGPIPATDEEGQIGGTEGGNVISGGAAAKIGE